MNQRQINILRGLWLNAYGDSAKEQSVINLIRRAVRENKTDVFFDVDSFIQQIVGK